MQKHEYKNICAKRMVQKNLVQKILKNKLLVQMICIKSFSAFDLYGKNAFSAKR